ncbi:MAG: hypothetical protein ACP5OC_04905 [Thermoplasmata archaeon]
MKRIAEIDKKLDLMVTISVKPSSQLFKITENLEWRYPGRVFEESGKKFFQIYLQKNLIPQKDLSILTFMPNYVIKNNYYTASFGIRDSKAVDLILNMLQIPSVILSENYVYRGETFYTFRYHNSVMKQVSDALQLLFEYGRCKLVYLGKSSGIVAMLNDASRNAQLSVIKITMQLSIIEALPADISDLEVISEIETRQMKAQGAKVILYGDSNLNWAKTVSEDDGIHEFLINQSVNFQLNEMVYNAKLPLTGSFGTVKGESIEITMFLPTYCMDEFLADFYKTSSGLEKSKIYLNMSAPLTPDMWDWI